MLKMLLIAEAAMLHGGRNGLKGLSKMVELSTKSSM